MSAYDFICAKNQITCYSNANYIWVIFTGKKFLAKFPCLRKTWLLHKYNIYCNPKFFVFPTSVLKLTRWHILGWPSSYCCWGQRKNPATLPWGDKLIEKYLTTEDSALNYPGGFTDIEQLISLLKFSSKSMKVCVHAWWNIFSLGTFFPC